MLPEPEIMKRLESLEKRLASLESVQDRPEPMRAGEPAAPSARMAAGFSVEPEPVVEQSTRPTQQRQSPVEQQQPPPSDRRMDLDELFVDQSSRQARPRTSVKQQGQPPSDDMQIDEVVASEQLFADAVRDSRRKLAEDIASQRTRKRPTQEKDQVVEQESTSESEGFQAPPIESVRPVVPEPRILPPRTRTTGRGGSPDEFIPPSDQEKFGGLPTPQSIFSHNREYAGQEQEAFNKSQAEWDYALERLAMMMASSIKCSARRIEDLERQLETLCSE